MVELAVVDDTLSVSEGDTVSVCVNVTNSQQQREKDIILTYSVINGNSFIGTSFYKLCNIHNTIVVFVDFLNNASIQGKVVITDHSMAPHLS